MKWGRRSPILCGDLVRAVQQESALAVAYHWGVCHNVVTRWRAALQVEPITVKNLIRRKRFSQVRACP
jgi:hypothetical protein